MLCLFRKEKKKMFRRKGSSSGAACACVRGRLSCSDAGLPHEVAMCREGSMCWCLEFCGTVEDEEKFIFTIGSVGGEEVFRLGGEGKDFLRRQEIFWPRPFCALASKRPQTKPFGPPSWKISYESRLVISPWGRTVHFPTRNRKKRKLRHSAEKRGNKFSLPPSHGVYMLIIDRVISEGFLAFGIHCNCILRTPVSLNDCLLTYFFPSNSACFSRFRYFFSFLLHPRCLVLSFSPLLYFETSKN